MAARIKRYRLLYAAAVTATIVGLAAFACLFLTTGVASAQSGETGLAGIWLGTLVPEPSVELRVAVTLSESDDGALSGTLRSIDQSSPDIPLDVVDYSNGTLILEITSVGIVIEGSLNEESGTLDCKFRQNGASFPLVFSRVDAIPTFDRPQTPEKPYPYIEEEVTFRNEDADVTLAGTLTIPRTGGPFPAVILLTGSGQQNRDEEVFDHKPFMVLADYLTRRGIAVLRCDDRGMGGSTGNFGVSTSGDFADDALAGVAFLKTREEIDPGKIGLIGHSEGGDIAPLAATRSSDVAFIVMMAGQGQAFSDVVIFQQTLAYKDAGMSEEDIALRNSWHKRLYDIAGSDLDNDAAADAIRELFATLSAEEQQRIGLTAEQLEKDIPTELRPWWRYYMGLDMESVLRRVRCPVLAINGGKDMQVNAAENLPIIEKALRDGGNPDYTVKELPGLNHLFQTAETGYSTEYATIEETMSPTVLELIGDWVLAR